MLRFRQSVHEDRESIHSLLRAAKLPTEDLVKGITTLYLAENEDGLVGVAGFEFYGGDALLRSVAIKPGMQRRGLGSQIVDFMLGEAWKKNVRSVILLTETARDFFLKKGFDVVDRSSVANDELKNSSEFAYACPKSAVCMQLVLKQ